MEERVYCYLIINHNDLRKLFNIRSDKSMRKVIQNIREDSSNYLIVGSISGNKGGFYICHTEDEITETIDNIRHRANQMHRMCHILQNKRKKMLHE